MRYGAIVIGVSAGGMNAMKTLIPALPANFTIPVLVVQHISANSDSHWIEIINNMSRIRVKEADEKELIEKGTVYIAPPNYHLLVEKDKTLSFTIGEKINFARPSIDLLFESAAEAYTNRLIGIVLTGSNSDGAKGLKAIKEKGGLVIVEDPSTAEFKDMPAAAIAAVAPDHVLPLKELIALLVKTGYAEDN